MAVQNQRLPKDNNINHATTITTAPTLATETTILSQPPPPPSVVTAPSPFAVAPANLSMPTTKNYQAQAPPTSASIPASGSSSAVISAPAHQSQHQQSNTVTSATASVQPPAVNANGGPRVSFNRDVHVKRIG